MLVVGHHVMEGGPEGPARPLGEGPEEAEHLVEALIVARDGAAARLMEDRGVGEQLSEGLHIGVVERLIASTNQLLVGVCHGPSSSDEVGNAIPDPRWR